MVGQIELFFLLQLRYSHSSEGAEGMDGTMAWLHSLLLWEVIGTASPFFPQPHV